MAKKQLSSGQRKSIPNQRRFLHFQTITPSGSLCRKGLMDGERAPRIRKFTFHVSGSHTFTHTHISGSRRALHLCVCVLYVISVHIYIRIFRRCVRACRFAGPKIVSHTHTHTHTQASFLEKLGALFAFSDRRNTET